MSALTTSFPRFLLLLLLLTVPRQGGCQEERELEGKDSDSPDDFEEHEAPSPVSIKYLVIWDEAPPLAARSSSSWTDFNPDIASVNCTSDLNCTAALYDLDVALSYDSDLPSAPYCIKPNGNESDSSEVGWCTCGRDKCVSYSRDYYNGGSTFYYCGPCGWVGSQCDKKPCTHPLAECSNNYCECTRDGKFYDLSYCYIPYFGKHLALEMLVATAIILLCCALLAYAYTKIRRRSSNTAAYLDRWSRGSTTQESPVDDTPPTYDDVVDKLPTYQDALEMYTKGGEDGGITNPSFQADFKALPTYLEASSLGKDAQTTPSATHTPTPIKTSMETTTPSETTTITEQKNLTENLKFESSDKLQGSTEATPDDSTTPLPQPIQLPLQAAIIDMQTKTPARPIQPSDRIDLQTYTPARELQPSDQIDLQTNAPARPLEPSDRIDLQTYTPDRPLQPSDLQTKKPDRPLEPSDRIDLQTNTTAQPLPFSDQLLAETMLSSQPVSSETLDMSHLDTKDMTTA